MSPPLPIMATCEETTASSHLAHVYFFLERLAITTDAETTEVLIATSKSQNHHSLQPATPSQAHICTKIAASSNDENNREHRKRTSSPSQTSVASEVGTFSSSGSDLNPLAPSFTPQAMHPPPPGPLESQLYKVCDTSDRGRGLFAIKAIPIGTPIICEKALMTVPGVAPQLALGPYCRLGYAEKAAYDKLHRFTPEDINLEQVSRTILIDRNDSPMNEEDVEEAVEEHVRVMSIYLINNVALKNDKSAIFATFSRLNHSCVPNVHHSFNPSLGKLTVHAVRDIEPGEELCTTYLGGEGCYQVRSTHLETLRANYGFTCRCVVCSDNTYVAGSLTTQSDTERDVMTGLAWGLDQYTSGDVVDLNGIDPRQASFLPSTAEEALLIAEYFIALLHNSGLRALELGKAYHKASIVSLALKDYDKAIEYAWNEAMVERNCLWTELDDMKQLGIAAECWWRQLLETIRMEAGDEAVSQYLRKPSPKLGNQKGKNGKGKRPTMGNDVGTDRSSKKDGPARTNGDGWTVVGKGKGKGKGKNKLWKKHTEGGSHLNQAPMGSDRPSGQEHTMSDTNDNASPDQTTAGYLDGIDRLAAEAAKR